jgi:hypothetical protein
MSGCILLEMLYLILGCHHTTSKFSCHAKHINDLCSFIAPCQIKIKMFTVDISDTLVLHYGRYRADEVLCEKITISFTEQQSRGD